MNVREALDRCSRNVAIRAFGLLLLLGIGCERGPETAPVSGVVTLDGQPLADGEIVFTPAAGRHSTARIDAEGRYELKYLPDVPGALVGVHRVKIMKFNPDTLLQEVPLRYNAESTLTAEVQRGANRLDFPLTRE